MDTELLPRLSGQKRQMWMDFLRRSGLEADDAVETTALVWDEGQIVATGSRQGNLLKCIAVDPLYQGQGLTATLLTQLRQDAFDHGHRHLFLYTKPRNKAMFSSLFFYPVAQSDQVLLMENQKNGIAAFLDTLDAPHTDGDIGAVVMNCNPFTRGHRYLIETAAKRCRWLYVFVLSEDQSQFSAADRLALVRAGTADLPNVTVHPTGPYLISSATFPTYFLKDQSQFAQIHCQLDLQIFLQYFVPKFGITLRFVGTEPLSPVTEQYNQALCNLLPASGVEVQVLPRLETDGRPISASLVRSLLGSGQRELLHTLVPDTTFSYLERNHLI